MSGRGHLWAIGYDEMNQAEQVRQEIMKLGEKHALLVFDTAVVVRYPEGPSRSTESHWWPLPTSAAVPLQASSRS